MIRQPPRSTRMATRFPYAALFRSRHHAVEKLLDGRPESVERPVDLLLWGVALKRIHQGLLGVAQFALRDREIAVLEPQSRSEEHTSELQSLMRISYAAFCLKKKNLN